MSWGGPVRLFGRDTCVEQRGTPGRGAMGEVPAERGRSGISTRIEEYKENDATFGISGIVMDSNVLPLIPVDSSLI